MSYEIGSINMLGYSMIRRNAIQGYLHLSRNMVSRKRKVMIITPVIRNFFWAPATEFLRRKIAFSRRDSQKYRETRQYDSQTFPRGFCGSFPFLESRTLTVCLCCRFLGRDKF